MKKLTILAVFALLTLSLSAQHVTPLNIHLTEVNPEALRQEYSGQSYLLELQRLDKLLKDDTKAIKDAQEQLKEEKNFQKQMDNYIAKAEASFKSLETLAQKEENEQKKLKDLVEKQLQFMNSSKRLDIETRTKSVEQLQEQRRALEATINATQGRQSRISNQPVQLQQMRTAMMVFSQELINKETDIKQLEANVKSRRAVIQSEMKNVKAQK